MVRSAQAQAGAKIQVFPKMLHEKAHEAENGQDQMGTRGRRGKKAERQIGRLVAGWRRHQEESIKN